MEDDDPLGPCCPTCGAMHCDWDERHAEGGVGSHVAALHTEIARLREVNAALLAALKVAREYVVRVDGTMAFTAPANRATAPDLAKIDAALAKAKGE